MIVSVTELRGYLRCPRQWHMNSFNGRALAPVFAGQAFQDGTVWHRAHEAWRKDLTTDFSTHALIQCSLELSRAKEAYKKLNGTYPSHEELASFAETLDLVRSMAENYQKHWGAPFADDYEDINSEQTVIVPIPHTDHFYEGTFDGLLRNKKTGKLFILDLKTFGRHTPFETIKHDLQFLDYMWILSIANIGELGGIIYDGAWKRKEAPKGKDANDLFCRYTFSHTPQEIRIRAETIRYLVNKIADDVSMLLTTRIHPVYNIPWDGCGWDCSIQSVCQAYNRGEPIAGMLETNFTTREKQGYAKDD